MQKKYLKILVQTALLLSLALVMRLFTSQMVQIGGAGGVRITFSGIFSYMIPVLFGPLIGGMAMGALDVIAFVIKPEGPFFIPLLTITAVLSGALTGVLWKYVRKLVINDFLKLLIAVGIADITITVINTFILRLTFPTLAKIPLIIYLSIRVAEALTTSVINTYVMSHLLKIYRKLN